MASSPTLHSPVSVRITRAQLELLVADLQPLVWRTPGMRGEWFFRTLPSDCDEAFVLVSHRRLEALWKRLESWSSDRQSLRYRLSLDVLDAAFCLTAVRAAARTKGCSSPPSSIPNTAVAKFRRSQLVRLLENYERRLRRLFLRETGHSEAATRLLQEFACYRKIVVHELFRPVPVLSRSWDDLKGQLFNQMVAIAQKGLSEVGNEVPPEKELRRLVSLWLRDVHRFRVAVAFPDLLRDPYRGKASLVRSTQARWARLTGVPVKKRDLASVSSDHNEQLRKVMVEVD